jgi:uncharacterized protein YegL
MKRVPVYILIDCSVSMSRVIAGATEAVGGLFKELRTGQNAASQAFLSIITFNNEATKRASWHRFLLWSK